MDTFASLYGTTRIDRRKRTDTWMMDTKNIQEQNKTYPVEPKKSGGNKDGQNEEDRWMDGGRTKYPRTKQNIPN